MPHHVAWPSIGLLHYTIATVRHLANLAGTPPAVQRYRAKVKQHGTNAAVQVLATSAGAEVHAQGRTSILTPEDDFKEFAKWVQANESYFKGVSGDHVTVFGEWCGPGVEIGMAVSKLPHKIFCVFAIQVGNGEGAVVEYDPGDIRHRLGPALKCPNLYVLPWHGGEVALDFSSDAALEQAAQAVNEVVLGIEEEDPWAKEVLGQSGMGEGLVFYPVGPEVPADPAGLCQLMWKAKGDKHSTTRARKPAQVDPVVVSGAAAFADLMVTEARLEQGVSAVAGGQPDLRLTGKFLDWLAGDVQKESALELAAAQLTWAQVDKAVKDKARQWYLSRAPKK